MRTTVLDQMGQDFFLWACAYFHPDCENLNILISIEEAFRNLQHSFPCNEVTKNNFLHKIKLFVSWAPWLEELNPQEMSWKDGKIYSFNNKEKDNSLTLTELFYIQSTKEKQA